MASARDSEVNKHGRGMLRSLKRLDASLAPSLIKRAQLGAALTALGYEVPALPDGSTQRAAPKTSVSKARPAVRQPVARKRKATAAKRVASTPKASKTGKPTASPAKPKMKMSTAILRVLGLGTRPLKAGQIAAGVEQFVGPAFLAQSFYVALGRLAKSGRIVAEGNKGSRVYRHASSAAASPPRAITSGGAATR